MAVALCTAIGYMICGALVLWLRSRAMIGVVVGVITLGLAIDCLSALALGAAYFVLIVFRLLISGGIIFLVIKTAREAYEELTPTPKPATSPSSRPNRTPTRSAPKKQEEPKQQAERGEDTCPWCNAALYYSDDRCPECDRPV